MTDFDLAFLSIAELGRRYAEGSLSPVDVADLHLRRIERLDPHLRAFQLVDVAGARSAALASHARWRSGAALGPLDGVPVTIKDNVDWAGFPTRHGSLTTPDTPAEADSPVVARLREAGCVLLGKTTLPEFGWKGLTDSRLLGVPTRNPWDLARSPGGSTGGGAAAVAAGIGTIAFGNDGGGSIRGPAALSGVFGIKPTFGRVPHHLQEGQFATLVAGGPLARSVTDAAVTLAIMAQPDDRDWFALPPAPHDWLAGLHPRLKDVRFAYAPALGGAEPDPAVRQAVDAAIERLRAAGAVVEDVGPVFDPLKPLFEPYWTAGMARRLRTMPQAQRDDLDPGYRALAEQGLDVDVPQLLAAEAGRAALGRRMAMFHRDHPILLTPTMIRLPPPVETIYHTPDYDRWKVGVPYTLPFNLTGQPGASILCGVSAEGLPVGLQVVAARYQERLVLEACLAIEQVLGYGPLHPVLRAHLQTLEQA
ncbi:MAG: amidase [Acetobacteraceae bacterium]|nr:amidase [Acetobacteraceae bacterium]